MLSANPAPTLPPRTAEQLLVDVGSAKVAGLSGTVVQRSDLGLPEIPGASGDAGGSNGSSSLTSMISGTHTLRVWYAGPDKGRIALLGTLGESDVVVNGRDLWVWTSDANGRRATHRRLPAKGDRPDVARTPPPGAPTTPEQAAARLVAAARQSTAVRTEGTARVAGRPVYELVLVPKDRRSLVGQVRVAVDSAKKVPLRVQVFATGRGTPAFEVAYTQVTFAVPGAEQFRFTPPPGTKVTEAPATPRHRDGAPGNSARPPVVGTGWTAVVVTRMPAVSRTPTEPGRAGRRPDGTVSLEGLLASAPRVRGAWGSGRLLRSHLLTVLVTDDGRVLAGAVTPELLYAAAGRR